MLTLASDFGSPYPAAMKGVILSRTDARLVDVGHDLPRQDVRAAAFWLREVLPYFPPAVHLAVVDPGVGTDRAALAVRAGDHALVGPDNGLLVPPARRLAAAADAPADGGARADADAPPDGEPEDDGAPFEVFEVASDDPESSTFHGRDVFAPAAAAVHEAGVGALDGLDRCSRADDYEDLRFPEPDVDLTAGRAVGEVLVVDGFGNAVTNVPGEFLADRFGGTPAADDGGHVTVDGERVPVARSYAAVGAGERLVTVGSHGNVELAANRGRGDEAFGVAPGSAVELSVE